MATIRIGKTTRAKARIATFDYAYATGRGHERRIGVVFQVDDGTKLVIVLERAEAREMCSRVGHYAGNGGE